MIQSVVANRLRPGLDPNDTSWVMVRSLEDWRAGQGRGLGYDSALGALQLAPLPRPELADTWLANAPVTGPDGIAWRVDSERDLLLRKAPCDSGFSPPVGIGGSGFATGRFHVPVSLSIDPFGRIWVADAGNGRVQVLAPRGDEVIAVVDEGLARPVHIAFDDKGTAYVTDAATRAVHVFSARFAALRRVTLATRDAWTGALWTPPPAPEPRACAVLADGTLAVFDPMRAGLWHMTICGEARYSLPWFADSGLPPGWPATSPRFVAQGEVIVGPLDGGTENFAWHRVVIDADLPDGTSVSVQTFAGNTDAPAAFPWAPKTPLAIPRAKADRAGAAFDRLVLPDTDMWPLEQLAEMIRDRPDLHAFDGNGPVNADRVLVPLAVARQLHAGDVIGLVTPAGGAGEVTISAISPIAAQVAASGDAASFAAPTSIALLMRSGEPLSYGPLDLGFLVDPAAAPIVVPLRDGTPEAVNLPAPLALFLRDGDVIAVNENARLEILSIDDDTVEIHFDAALAGDFATASLTLVDTAGRLLVRDALPDIGQVAPGTMATVIDDAGSERHAISWVDGQARTVWLAAGRFAGTITAQSWTDVEFDKAQATDRGRYIWLRLKLQGAGLPAPDGVGPATIAGATPRLRAVRITGPRPSLLSLLPALYSRRDPATEQPGANFIERFLTLFEGQFTRIEEAYESVSRLINPRAADQEWLTFLAAWLDIAFDPSWPMDRRRQLVIEAAALQAGRGTPRAMARWLEIFTGRPVAIAEGFTMRPPAPITLGESGALGIASLAGAGPALPDSFAHRFTVGIDLSDVADRAAARAAARKIIEAMKPAHTSYKLNIGNGEAPRIGIDTAIGNIFIPAESCVPACVCESDDADRSPAMPVHLIHGLRQGRGPIVLAATSGG